MSNKYYEASSESVCIDLPVLEFLTGHPLDDLAYNLIDTLRPSQFRVIPCGGIITDDSIFWRVTCFMDYNDRISRITQEVWAGMRGGLENGMHLRKLMNARGIL